MAATAKLKAELLSVEDLLVVSGAVIVGALVDFFGALVDFLGALVVAFGVLVVAFGVLVVSISPVKSH